jgi:hypothetical protein
MLRDFSTGLAKVLDPSDQSHPVSNHDSRRPAYEIDDQGCRDKGFELAPKIGRSAMTAAPFKAIVITVAQRYAKRVISIDKASHGFRIVEDTGN